MKKFPLLFGYKDLIGGNGFFAGVEVSGRALLEEDQDEVYWWVSFGEKAYRRLPRGRHGKRTNSETEIGHLKNLVRHLGVEDCAKRVLPQLA